MNSTLLLGALLVTASVISMWMLRRLPNHIRLAFDFVFFAITSAFLVIEHISPFFAADGSELHAEELWRRAICGAWWLLGSRFLVGILRFALHHDMRTRETRLYSDLMAGTIYLVTALVVLNSVLSLPVRGVLATSGIIAVVLGLALQNTLSDVFSGIAVGIEAPFRVGDRIMINNQIEGQVVQVNWRSIRILTDNDDIAIFPNSQVAKAEIVNRSFPSSRRTGSVDIACDKSAAPERVIEALLEGAMLVSTIELEPPASAVLIDIKRRKSVYRLAFGAASRHAYNAAHDQIVQRCRQQLHFAGLLAPSGGAHSNASASVSSRLSDSDILKQLVLFESLEARDIEQLSASVHVQMLKPDQALFAEGGTDATLYIVGAGVLSMSRNNPSGGQEVLGVIGAGEYVGEIGLLTGAPHGASATARTRCRILQIPKSVIAPLLAQKPELALAFEASVHHGMQLLRHSSPTHAVIHAGATAQLLTRIREFFGPHNIN